MKDYLKLVTYGRYLPKSICIMLLQRSIKREANPTYMYKRTQLYNILLYTRDVNIEVKKEIFLINVSYA